MVTPEAIEKAKVLVSKSMANYRYFFGKLASAEWVQPLQEAGFFRNPPEVGGPWPESRYLVCVADLDPDTVYTAAMGIPQTENVNVLRDLVEVASKMPEDKCVAICTRFLPSYRKTHFSWIDDKFCDLIIKLAPGQHAEQVLILAKAVLEVMPPSLEDMEKYGPNAAIFARCRTHMGSYEYEALVNQLVPALATSMGVPAIRMFAELLADSIRYEEHGEPGGPEDFSTIWFPAFDWPVQTYSEPKAALAGALSRGAETVMQERPNDRAKVLACLQQGPYKVFRRIEIHLLRLFPDRFDDRINEVIGSRVFYDDYALAREYQQLVAAQFRLARPMAQTHYLACVEELFDFPKVESELRGFYGDQTPHEVIRSTARGRALNRLAGLREALPPEWQARYDGLVKEVGEPESSHTRPHMVETRATAPVSPKTADELKRMSDAELIAFLRDWRAPNPEPASDWLSPEGMGRQLEQVVKEAPSRFTVMVDEIKTLKPTYVRHIIEGLQNALSAGVCVDWGQAVRLCLWVMEQESAPQEEQRFDYWEDRGWDSAKAAATGLVECGLRSQSYPLPIELKDGVWRIVMPFTESPDPAPEKEQRDAEESNSLIDRAINSRRGRAMHAVVHYALWLRRHFESSDEQKPQIVRGFDAMPEVRDVLDLHLDPAREPSLAVRTVYGEFFPWLVLLDEGWACSVRQLVFPSAENERKLWCAAWGAYVISNPPYDKVVDVLREEYIAAIDNLGKPWPVCVLRSADPEGRLAQHLIQLYARAAIGAGDELWERFWQSGASSIRARALQFIGRTIDIEKEPLPRALREKFVAIAEARIKAAEASEDKKPFLEEMRALGWWFANKAFDTDWAISNLDRVLDLTDGQIEAEFRLAQRLAEMCKSLPAPAAKCLRKMVTGTAEVWGILGHPEHIRTVLRTAKDSGDAQAFFEVRKISEALVLRGFDDFRTL